MRTLIVCTVLFFLANNSSLFAQKTNVWKGGFPGHESDWKHYRNWSLGKTPDAFDRVIIPDVSTGSRKYPVFTDGEIEVLSLEVQSGASLTLFPKARIVSEAFSCNGSCNGCEQRLLIEGTIPPIMASKQ